MLKKATNQPNQVMMNPGGQCVCVWCNIAWWWGSRLFQPKKGKEKRDRFQVVSMQSSKWFEYLLAQPRRMRMLESIKMKLLKCLFFENIWSWRILFPLEANPDAGPESDGRLSIKYHLLVWRKTGNILCLSIQMQLNRVKFTYFFPLSCSGPYAYDMLRSDDHDHNVRWSSSSWRCGHGRRMHTNILSGPYMDALLTLGVLLFLYHFSVFLDYSRCFCWILFLLLLPMPFGNRLTYPKKQATKQSSNIYANASLEYLLCFGSVAVVVCLWK